MGLAVLMRLTPWSTVFVGDHVNLRGNDAWYHVRVVDHLLANFPHRLTVDPYAAPEGQYVPLAPLFDLLLAGVAWVLGLGAPSDRLVETVAVWLPPVCGAAVAGLAYLLARRLFDRRSAVLAAALVAVMPGHLLERTLLGFADHHALEAVLVFATLIPLMRALGESGRTRTRWAAVAGVALGAYLLTWSSGAFLVLALTGWVAAQAWIDSWGRREADAISPVVVPLAVVALVLVVAFQPWVMPRFGTQVATLLALGLTAAGLDRFRRVCGRAARPGAAMAAGLAGVGVLGTTAVWALAPGTFASLSEDAGRLIAGSAQFSVLEARPLLWPYGTFTWAPAWDSFRTTFPIGVATLVVFAARGARSGSRPHVLMAVWCGVTLLATLGQNRFGYYLGPNLAVLTGWTASGALGWVGGGAAGVRLVAGRGATHWVGMLVVVAGLFAPCIGPAIELGRRHQGQTPEWHAALEWFREHTPEPFGTADYYRARYDQDRRSPDYTVMTWWDYGYWVTRTARRVPTANPTQFGADHAARFFTATAEDRAASGLESAGARYVIANRFLPLRLDAEASAIYGAFESILGLAGRNLDRYYEAYYEPREDGTFRRVWVFYPAYYRAMAVRLAVFGVGETTPREAWVVSYEDRSDAVGAPYRALVASVRFTSYAAAAAYRASLGPGNHRIVGMDPTEPCVPLDPLPDYEPIYGGAGAEVRIYEYVPAAAGPTAPR